MFFHSFPRYDTGVSQEPPQRGQPFPAQRRRPWCRCPRRISRGGSAGSCSSGSAWRYWSILVGVWLYQRSTSSQDSQKALRDGERMLKAGRYVEAIQYLRSGHSGSERSGERISVARACECGTRPDGAGHPGFHQSHPAPAWRSPGFSGTRGGPLGGQRLRRRRSPIAGTPCAGIPSSPMPTIYGGWRCAEWANSASPWRISTAQWNFPRGWTRTSSARAPTSHWASTPRPSPTWIR